MQNITQLELFPSGTPEMEKQISNEIATAKDRNILDVLNEKGKDGDSTGTHGDNRDCSQ